MLISMHPSERADDTRDDGEYVRLYPHHILNDLDVWEQDLVALTKEPRLFDISEELILASSDAILAAHKDKIDAHNAAAKALFEATGEDVPLKGFGIGDPFSSRDNYMRAVAYKKPYSAYVEETRRVAPDLAFDWPHNNPNLSEARPHRNEYHSFLEQSVLLAPHLFHQMAPSEVDGFRFPSGDLYVPFIFVKENSRAISKADLQKVNSPAPELVP